MMTVLDLVKKMALADIDRNQGLIDCLLSTTPDLSELSVKVEVSVKQRGCEDPNHWPLDDDFYHKCPTCYKEFRSK